MPITRSDLATTLYGGRDPHDVPAYALSEVADYLYLPLATVRSWVVGRKYPAVQGEKTFPPLIAVADPENRLLSFRNLVELHVLGSLRREYRVKVRAIRKAIEYLRKRFKADHPLLDQQMLTDGTSLFIEQFGEVVNVSEDGQMEMVRLLEAYLKRIDRDQTGTPIRLFPVTRKDVEKSPRLVAIDPAIRFGKPCIAGTSIPTSIIAERYAAGDSSADLARDYERSQEEIEEAVRYAGRRKAS